MPQGDMTSERCMMLGHVKPIIGSRAAPRPSAGSALILDVGHGLLGKALGPRPEGPIESDSSSGVGLAVEDRHWNSQVHGHPSSPIGQKRDALGSSAAVDK